MSRLVLLPHLQRWDGSSLTLRLLMIPQSSPLDPLNAQPGSPSFASANFKIDVFLTVGLDSLPRLGGTAYTNISVPTAARSHEVFTALQSQFIIDPNPPQVLLRPANTQVFKHLPTTFQKAANYAPGDFANVFTDSTYACALKAASANTPKQLPPPDPKIPWGKVIAIILRNSMLAEQAGLIRSISVPIRNHSDVESGGFLHVNVSSDVSGGALSLTQDDVRIYAARFPPINRPEALFTPVVFPVLVTPKSFNYDEVFGDVDDYWDGWAKVVHCVQPQRVDPNGEDDDDSRPVNELGVRLGWDDVQVTKWMNRQMDTSLDDLGCALGISGYRIDVQPQDSTEWHSLVMAHGELKIGSLDIGSFIGELGVETHPVQLQANRDGMYWLPTYLTAWKGPAIGTLDAVQLLLNGGDDKRNEPGLKGVDPGVALQYGKSYSFRVRLKDHTGSGPSVNDAPLITGPSPVTACDFRRWIRPLEPLLVNAPPSKPDSLHAPTTIEMKRPLLGYPAANCTGKYSNANDMLLADLPAALAGNRKPGIPDPDVDSVEITIEVQGFIQDPATTDGSFMPIAKTSRRFPSDFQQPLVVELQWIDMADVGTLQQTISQSGPVQVPTARTLRLRFGSLCFEDSRNAYFGADDVRRGTTTAAITLRKNPLDETDLFLPVMPSERIKAIYMQPEPTVNAALLTAQQAAGKPNERLGDNASRLASAIGLLSNGLTVRFQPGRRGVFGCSSSVRHTIGPDLASITFGSESDLALHWIVVIKMTLKRDWSWTGLLVNGLTVQRDGAAVGSFSPNLNVSLDALSQPQRSQIDLVFFDAVDPKATAGEFPRELTPSYTVTWNLTGNPTTDPPLTLPLRLPVTTPPFQVPRVVSAGIAMSAYRRDEGTYANSAPRQKMLWIELEEPPSDDKDSYFARVLRNAPDQLLSISGLPQKDREEPPLAVDPEPIRMIMQGQSDDRAGLDAMQPMVPADGNEKIHWLLPLPAGLSDTSPELFGFFKYELRVGHSGLWSTAQGRFSAPLQLAGVQHPPPPLLCNVIRTHARITVTAPFAQPVLDGVSVQPKFASSDIWILLYVQLTQIDGVDRRNFLIQRQRANDLSDPKDPDRVRQSGPLFGTAFFDIRTVSTTLGGLGLKSNAPLSVLAVEMMPQDVQPKDPLGANLGGQRILRTSNLVAVPHIC